MDLGIILGDSFNYTKEAVVGKWKQWGLLVIATILLCLPLLGYSLRVLRGEKPAPEVTDWGTLFVDGIKYVIVSLIWAIPAIIIFVVTIGAGVLALLSDPAVMNSAGSVSLSVNPATVMGIIGGMFVGLRFSLLSPLLPGSFLPSVSSGLPVPAAWVKHSTLAKFSQPSEKSGGFHISSRSLS